MDGLNTLELGKWGEDTACAFLKLKGLEIIERNYRVGRREVDIVARAGRELVFVEVKVRCRDDFGGPWGAVDSRKQRELTRVAAGYLRRSGNLGCACRFDVVAITIDENSRGMRLRHIERAFYASEDLALFV